MRRGHAHHAFSWTRPSARTVRLVTALLAVVCLAAVTMVTRPPTAHGSAAANVARQFVGPDGVPDVARWQDEAQKTAFSIRLRAPAAASAKGSASQTSFSAAIGNTYSFTLPSGDQIVGEVFLTQQPNGDFDGPGVRWRVCWASKPQQVVADVEHTLRCACPGGICPDQLYRRLTVTTPIELAVLCKKATAIPLPCNLDVTPQAHASIPWRRRLWRCPRMKISSSPRIMPHRRRRLPGSRSMTPHPASYAGSIPTSNSLTPWRAPSRRSARLRRSRPSLRRLPCRQAQQARATLSPIATSRSRSTARIRPARVASYYLLEGGQWRFWFSV